MDAELPRQVEVRRNDQCQCHTHRKEGDMNTESLPLPQALRDQEISESDFKTLVRIAEDPKATSGRLNRTPRKIPTRNREAVRS